MYKKILGKIKKPGFLRNTLILMSGTTIAQLIPIIVSPILTRLYTADEFGVLSIFSTIVFFLGALSAFKYELAIVLPRNDIDGDNVYVLSILISFIINLVLFIIFIFIAHPFSIVIKAPALSYLLPWTAIAGFFIALFNITNYYLIRQKKFKSVSTNKITRTLSTAILQLALGLVKTKYGLIYGFGFGQFAANTFNFIKIKYGQLFKRVKTVKLIALARRYKKFPRVSFPANLLYRLSVETFNIILPVLYDVKTLGFYFLAYRMTIAPITFIGMAFSDSYLKRASDELKERGHLKFLFKKLVYKLLAVSIPIYALIFLLAIPIFSFVFGKSWTVSGLYAKILTPWLFTRFLFFSFSQTYTILEKLNYPFVIQSINTIFSFFVFALAYFFNWKMITWITVFSIGMSIIYLVSFLSIIFLINKQYKQTINKI